jgi:hypothetical protein
MTMGGLPADFETGEEGIPQGLKPLFFGGG